MTVFLFVLFCACSIIFLLVYKTGKYDMITLKVPKRLRCPWGFRVSALHEKNGSSHGSLWKNAIGIPER